MISSQNAITYLQSYKIQPFKSFRVCSPATFLAPEPETMLLPHFSTLDGGEVKAQGVSCLFRLYFQFCAFQ